MRILDLQSERYSPTGNVASTGVLNQLGRPHLDLLTVLVRETVQNSWDARLSGHGPVRFGIAGSTPDREQLDVLRQVVFPNDPGNLGLGEALSDPGLRVLAIYDRGTTGLAGPTRADLLERPGEPHNFVNLLRNVGQPTERQLAGGTFGYGKAALYLASQPHTICAHTHCLSGGTYESRFIASALGPNYTAGQASGQTAIYTGRHWWGRAVDDLVDPVRGAEADELAQALGLPGFAPGETGATLLILQPHLGKRTPEQAMNLMATSLLWNFWPKMLAPGDGRPPMECELFWQGNPIPIPAPQDYPPLDGFTHAMKVLKDSGSQSVTSMLDTVVSIDSYRPKRHLGMLALHRFPARPHASFDTGADETQPPVSELCHHVALMRQPELVVKYLPGPALPTGQIEYAGVFIAGKQVDSIFAGAEPPTHDDWVYQFIENGTDKSAVRVALNRIQQVLEDFARPGVLAPDSRDGAPLGAFAEQLGGLLPGEDGPGASVELPGGPAVEPPPSPFRGGNRRGGASGATGHPGVRLEGESRLELNGAVPALFTGFVVDHTHGSSGTHVHVEVHAVLDGNDLETSPPPGDQVPQVVCWEGPDGATYPGSPDLFVPAAQPGPWRVAVSIPEDAMVRVMLTAEEAG